jgi:hypothetical protein
MPHRSVTGQLTQGVYNSALVIGPDTPVPATAKTFPIQLRYVKEKPDRAVFIGARKAQVPFDTKYSSVLVK